MSEAGAGIGQTLRAHRRLLVSVGAILIVLLVMGALIDRYLARRLRPEEVERLLNDALGPATGGFYTVSIGELDAALLRGDLRLGSVTLRSRPSGDEALPPPAVRFEMDVDALSIIGASIWRIALFRELRADRIEIRNAAVRVIFDPAAARPATTRESGAPGPLTPAQQIHDALAGVPLIQIGEVEITASLRVDTLAGGTEPAADREVVSTDHADQIDVTLEGLEISEDVDLDSIRGGYTDDLRFHISGIESHAIGGSRLEIGSITGSRRAQTLEISDAALVPLQSAREYLAQTARHVPDRIAVSVARLRVDRFEYRRLLQRLELRIGLIAIVEPKVDVLHDKHKPGAPPRTHPATMPHDALQQLTTKLTVAKIELENGHVSYSERAEDADKPGVITFEGIRGTITNFSNEAANTDASRPTRAELHFQLNGRAETTVQIDLPLLSPAPRMSVGGRIGPFEAQMLDTILAPLEGIRAASGSVQSVYFTTEYIGERATGSFNMLYRDLKLQFVNKNTGGRNLGSKVKSFLANRLAVHGSNEPKPGKPARVGRIDSAIDPRSPFFKIFWAPIRDGLMDIVAR